MRAPAITALIVAFSASLAAEAQLFKCVGRDGKVVYQDSKCTEDAKQSTVAPPTPPSSRAPEPAAPASDPAAAAKAATPGAPQPAQPEIAMDVVVGMLSNYQSCVEDAPGFSAKFDAAFQAWKRRNRVALTRYDQDGPAQRQVRESLEFERRKTLSDNAEARAAKLQMCETNIGPLLGSAK
jgi:uncharacterized protein DUF4124